MSNQNPQFLQKTVLDVKIQFSSILTPTPVNMMDGTGIAQIMEIDSTTLVEYDVTAGGDTSAALLPVKTAGKIFLHPASPAINSIAAIADNYVTTGIIVPGVITMSSAAGGWSYTFTHVVVSKLFTGFTLGKVVEDYVYTFEARPPLGANLSQLANSTAGLVNVV